MARILIDIDEALLRDLMALVKKGRYEDMDQLMEVAATNQLKLEKTTTGFIELPKRAKRNSSNSPREERGGRAEIASGAPHQEFELTTTFLQGPTGDRKTVAAPSTRDLLFPNYTNLEDIFTWGQYNRILPVKVGLRVLDNMLSEHPALLDGFEVLDLAEYHKQAAATAREFGLYVKNMDDTKGNKRTMRLSNGLPIGPDEVKSSSRYINHFLAKRRKKDSVLDGFEARLGLVNIVETEPGTYCIGITEEGLKFSRIDNVLFEGHESDWPLSRDEIAFYLKHVIDFVPEEKATLQEVLILINRGDSSTATIDTHLAAMHKNLGWTGPMVVTNRAGTLSRLWELRLIKKSGIAESDIQLTKDGEAFLKRLENGRSEVGG